MDNGNLGINLVYTYAGNPTSVSTQAFNPPKGSFIIDTTTPAIWQKTSTADNTGMVLIATGSGALTPSSIAATGAVTSSSPSAGVGYAAGAGGTVTQATNRTTGVTLSKISGQITTASSSLAAETAATFIVTNTVVGLNDVVIISMQSGSNGGNTTISVTVTTAGSFSITVANQNASGGTAETGAIIINYVVIKGVAA